MKYTLELITNKDKGKAGLLLAHGPSLKSFILDIVNNYSSKKDKCCIFSCGEPDVVFGNMNLDLKLDYWVTANSIITIDSCKNRFNAQANTMLVYADSVDLSDSPETKLTVDYLGYDQRHFHHKTCLENFGTVGQVFGKSCCDFTKKERESGRLTIQEYLQKLSNSNIHYSQGDTVALHMLSLAIIVGCNPIYLFGVDLDYSQGYVDGKSQNTDSFSPYINNIVNDFNIINQAAKNLGIKIINFSSNSPIQQVLDTWKNY